jgi:hypothetical protein
VENKKENVSSGTNRKEPESGSDFGSFRAAFHKADQDDEGQARNFRRFTAIKKRNSKRHGLR